MEGRKEGWIYGWMDVWQGLIDWGKVMAGRVLLKSARVKGRLMRVLVRVTTGRVCGRVTTGRVLRVGVRAGVRA